MVASGTGPEQRGRSAWRYALGCALALALVMGAYANHFDNGFHFDDGHALVDNLAIRSLGNTARFFTDASTFSARPQNATYRPLLSTSYALDYALGGGLDPRTFHRTQLALHLSLGVVLLLLFRRLLDEAQPDPARREAHGWIALLGAALFCVHTGNTETVNYISARSSLLATLGVAGSLLVYVAWPRGRRSQLHLLPMTLAAFAKPSAVMYAPLLLVYALLFEQHFRLGELGSAAGRRGAGRKLGRALVSALPALVVAGGLFGLITAMDTDTLVYATLSPETYLRTQPFVWLHYFRLFLLPVGLTADSDWAFAQRWDETPVLVGLAFVAALLVLGARAAETRRLRPVAFGLAWFALALLPTSSVVPLSEPYNEHRLYMPFAGLALALPWWLWTWLLEPRWSRPRLRGAVAALIPALLVAHAVGTHQRNEVWRNSATLWGDVVQKSPRNGRGLMNYGLTHMAEGRFDEALALFERAEALLPYYAPLQTNLGIVRAALGREAEAEAHLQRALALDPGYAAGRFFYARWLLERGRGPEALEQLARAAELAPASRPIRLRWLELLAALGDRPSVERVASELLALDPADASARAYAAGQVPGIAPDVSADACSALAWERLQREEWIEAAIRYRRALQLDASRADDWLNLGWSQLMLGFDEDAAAHFARTLELDPSSELARNNLALARRGP